MAQETLETDLFDTSQGPLSITFVGHGSLMLAFNGQTLHVDPYGRLADYGKLPDADLVLITHEHSDHLDAEALKQIRTEHTQVVTTEVCAKSVPGAVVMRNGDKKTVAGIEIEAVPAYNLVHQRPDGTPFHPKGQGNGYVLRLGDKRVYIAGDTENTPEMKALKEIDIAFLPMNLPYTMTPAMVADAVKAFHPLVLYPYHYGQTDVSALTALLADVEDTDVRVRKMQ